MAVGETIGAGRARRQVGRRRPPPARPGDPAGRGPSARADRRGRAAPWSEEVDPRWAMLAEEEEIERRTCQDRHETPELPPDGRWSLSMLMPKKVKHCKQHRGRMRAVSPKGGSEDHLFGDYAHPGPLEPR